MALTCSNQSVITRTSIIEKQSYYILGGGGFQWFRYKGRKFTKYKEDKSVDDLLRYLHTNVLILFLFANKMLVIRA